MKKELRNIFILLFAVGAMCVLASVVNGKTNPIYIAASGNHVKIENHVAEHIESIRTVRDDSICLYETEFETVELAENTGVVLVSVIIPIGITVRAQFPRGTLTV